MLAGQLAAVLVGGCLLGLAIYTAVYGYRPITRRQLADLKGRPLVHVTSQTAAAAMADPTGELWLDPRRARLPAVILSRRPVLRLGTNMLCIRCRSRGLVHPFSGLPARCC